MRPDSIQQMIQQQLLQPFPDEVITYLEEISSEKVQSIDLASKVLEANDNWDNELITYQEAKDEFAKLY